MERRAGSAPGPIPGEVPGPVGLLSPVPGRKQAPSPAVPDEDSSREAAQRLLELVRCQELFHRTIPTRRSVATWSPVLAECDSTWFGVGVSARDVSRALPLDVLVLVFAQEMVRRELGHQKGHILVADTNAIRSGVSSLDVRRAATRIRHTLTAVVERFGFPVEVLRASDLGDVSERDAIVADIEAPNEYVAEQLAQMELMRRAGAGVKIGWTMPGFSFDERYFDTLFLARFGHSPVCIYTIGGRTLNPRRPRACPYLCEEPADRLLLQPDEDIKAKLERRDLVGRGATAVRGYRRLLGKLARAQHRLLGDRRRKRPEQVIQTVLDHLPEPS